MSYVVYKFLSVHHLRSMYSFSILETSGSVLAFKTVTMGSILTDDDDGGESLELWEKLQVPLVSDGESSAPVAPCGWLLDYLIVLSIR